MLLFIYSLVEEGVERVDIGERIEATFGKVILVKPEDIEADPRWPIERLDLIDAKKWLGGPFTRVPLIVRRVDGGKFVAVSPSRSFAAYRALVEAGEEDRMPVVIASGMDEIDAKAVRNAVEWYVEPAHDGDWMFRLAGAYAGLERCSGRSWMVGGPWRFFAAACGTSTAMLTRVQRIAHDAVPEVISLVEEGVLTMRAANEAAKLPPEKQRAFAKAVHDDGTRDPRRAAMLIQCFVAPKLMPVSELLDAIEALAMAVRNGETGVGVDDALRVQEAAGALVRAACGKR